MGLGQPATSAALGRLRALFHDELFVRAGGAMRPTQKAVEIAPGLLGALAQIRATLDAGVGFDPATAKRAFAVGGTDYTALVLLPPLVAHVRRAAPGLDLRAIGYEKGAVAEMLDRGEVDVALGVFPDPPERAVVTRLFRERFVGLARAGHPAVADGRVGLDAFAALPHALVTTRRDATGALDGALAERGLKRRVALTLPHAMVLPAVLESSDLVAALPSRLAERLQTDGLQRFELPVETKPWTVSMLWPATARNDRAAIWLRATISACSAAV